MGGAVFIFIPYMHHIDVTVHILPIYDTTHENKSWRHPAPTIPLLNQNVNTYKSGKCDFSVIQNYSKGQL